MRVCIFCCLSLSALPGTVPWNIFCVMSQIATLGTEKHDRGVVYRLQGSDKKFVNINNSSRSMAIIFFKIYSLLGLGYKNIVRYENACTFLLFFY